MSGRAIALHEVNKGQSLALVPKTPPGVTHDEYRARSTS